MVSKKNSQFSKFSLKLTQYHKCFKLEQLFDIKMKTDVIKLTSLYTNLSKKQN